MNARPLAALAAALLVLTACSGGEDVAAAPSPEAATSCPAAPTPVDPPADATTDLETKPVVEVPSDPPPATLEVSDIVVGDGELACSGDAVEMQYVGVLYADGTQFDASWDRGGEPFPFQLGGGRVIGGWDQGIVGMRAGGRRQLVIPPDLGYGDQGAGADIPPGATLVFVVDLLQVG
ncbi:MAG: FKBP-type peptidyl-prolyl cis-trans isomerase [Frankiaceae bacterium]|nr:FKBP-type peptidyl-prolyl cis-trans isomerase [Frankiaceae bacterium]